MGETWKPLSEDSRYEVSDLGRARKNGKLKKLTKNRRGYLHTAINSKVQGVHQLVLKTFKPNPVPSFYDRVDHINQNQLDNRLENLRWSNATLNQWNCDKRKGFKKHKSGRYESRMFLEGKYIYLGTFASEAAAKARYLEAIADARQVYDPYPIY